MREPPTLAERFCAAIAALQAALPDDGFLAEVPTAPLLIETAIAALPSDGPVPAWTTDWSDRSPPGWRALVSEMLCPGESPPFQRVATAIRDAGLGDGVERILEHPTGPVSFTAEGSTVWVPVPSASADRSLVLGLDDVLEDAASGRFDDRRHRFGAAGWKPFSAEFLDERRRAWDAAQEVLVDLGFRREADGVPVPDIAAALPPTTITECDAAAGIALTVLAGRLGLPTPASSSCVVIGHVSEDLSCTPVGDRPEDVGGFLDVVEQVLARTERGWTLIKRGLPARRVDDDADGELPTAARLLWGTDVWTLRCRQVREQLLAEVGWELVDLPRPVDPTRPRVDTDVVRDMTNVFRAAKAQQRRTVVVHGGPTHSGRSTAASLVAGHLAASRWQVVGMRHREGRLGPVDEMTRVTRLALALRGVQTRVPTLLVIDDLVPGGETHLGPILTDLAGKEGVQVLAVALFQQGGGGRWNTAGAEVSHSISKTKGVERLAGAMLAAAPDTYGLERSQVAAAVEHSGGDLTVLAELLAGVSAEIAVPAVDRPADHSVEAWRGLRIVAAYTLIGSRAAIEDLPPGTTELLVRVRASIEPGGACLSGRRVARRVLSTVDPRVDPTAVADPDTAVADVLSGHLRSLLMAGADSRAIATLVRACRVDDPLLLDTVLRAPGLLLALTGWTPGVSPAHAGAVLLELDVVTRPPDGIIAVVRDLLDRAADQVPVDLGVDTLATLLRLVARYRAELEKTEADTGVPHDEEGVEGRSGYDKLVLALQDEAAGLRAVLRRPASLSDRVGLALLMRRASVEALSRLVVDHAGDLVGGIEQTSDHRALVRRLSTLVEQCGRDLPELAAVPSIDRPLLRLDRVQAMLAAVPSADAGFREVAGWLALKVHFLPPGTRWEDVITQYIVPIGTSLSVPTVTAAEIGHALAQLVSTDRGFTTKLVNEMLNRTELAPRLRSVLGHAAPADAALLVSTVNGIHAGAMRLVLHDVVNDDLVPRRDLAEALARRVVADVSGLSLLLQALVAAEEWCTLGGTRFSTMVAEKVGREKVIELVEADQRPTVLLHLFRALWECWAPYWMDVEYAAFELVVRALSSWRARHRPAAAHLALLLGTEDHLGEEFLTGLAAELDEEHLFRSMTRPVRADALTHLHRLARALFPALPARYVRAYRPDRMIGPVLGAPPQALIDYVRVLVETMSMGGEEVAGALLARHVADLSDRTWSARIATVYRPTELAAAVNGLHRLDPAAAAVAASELGTPVQDGRPGLLLSRILRRVHDPRAVVELLLACHRIDRQLGATLFADLRRTPWAWNVLKDEIRYEQNTSVQCKMLRDLGELGLLPLADDYYWLHTDVFEHRWMRTSRLVTSPRMIAAMLRVLGVWGHDRARRFVGALDGDKIVRRIGRGAHADLRELPALISGLEHAVRPGGGDDLLRRVVDATLRLPAEDLVRSTGLSAGSRLLGQLSRHASGAERDVAAELSRLLTTELCRGIVIDHAAHWRHLGWAAAVLTNEGWAGLVPTEEPGALPSPAFPAEAAWARTWLPGVAADDDLPALIRDFSAGTRTDLHPDRTAMVSIAAARAGVPLPDQNAVQASQIVHAGLGLLTIAYETAPTSPALAALLDTVTPALRERLRRPQLAIDPYLAQLRSHLDVPQASDPEGTGCAPSP